MSSQISSTFSVILPVLGHPERSSSLTDTQPALRNVNVIQKPLPIVKMFSKSLLKHFKGFSSRFTKLHAKLGADTLLDFAILCRQNKTRSQKSTRVRTVRVLSTVSRGRRMQ
jgi:hypothetical protein